MGSTPAQSSVVLMARYNLWANEQFGAYFGASPVPLVTQVVPSSFPSIEQTLMHIWDAQDIWYRRLQGESPMAFANHAAQGLFTEVITGLVNSSARLVSLAESLTAETLDEEISYNTLSSGPQTSKRFEILLHVCNHSMYHRGQCITMARSLGMIDPPSTDLIRFLRL